jgi:hypothetical protein
MHELRFDQRLQLKPLPKKGELDCTNLGAPYLPTLLWGDVGNHAFPATHGRVAAFFKGVTAVADPRGVKRVP